jgi:chemotaxis protein CheD
MLVVGLGAMDVTSATDATLVTYALGSCLGVAVYDPVARVGGMLHAMMPRSEIDVARADERPALFVDTGIPALFRACYALGARKDRLVVRLAGGASIHGADEDQFQIGKRNLLMARQLFWKNGVLVHAQDVGGSAWRTMTLHIRSGTVVVRSGRTDRQL